MENKTETTLPEIDPRILAAHLVDMFINAKMDLNDAPDMLKRYFAKDMVTLEGREAYYNEMVKQGVLNAEDIHARNHFLGNQEFDGCLGPTPGMWTRFWPRHNESIHPFEVLALTMDDIPADVKKAGEQAYADKVADHENVVAEAVAAGKEARPLESLEQFTKLFYLSTVDQLGKAVAALKKPLAEGEDSRIISIITQNPSATPMPFITGNAQGAAQCANPWPYFPPVITMVLKREDSCGASLYFGGATSIPLPCESNGATKPMFLFFDILFALIARELEPTHGVVGTTPYEGGFTLEAGISLFDYHPNGVIFSNTDKE